MAAETHGKKGIKSAYERALERMESEGIERPREEAFTAETLAGMEEARKRAEAKLAELEILHKGRLRKLQDPAAFATEEKEYQAERRRHDDLLQSFGVTAFESEGRRFDPTVHEALGVVECDTHEPGTVHSEFRRGYRWNGELLRPARVMVARGRPTGREESWIRRDLG